MKHVDFYFGNSKSRKIVWTRRNKEEKRIDRVKDSPPETVLRVSFYKILVCLLTL